MFEKEVFIDDEGEIEVDKYDTYVYQGVRFRDGSLGVVLITRADSALGVSLTVIVPYQATKATVGSGDKTYEAFMAAVCGAIDQHVETDDYEYVLEKVSAHAANAYSTLWTP